jgi:hypothetical protein
VPIAVSGQQITGNIAIGANRGRLQRLLGRAGFVGARDRRTEATLLAAAPANGQPRINYTFDDALPLLLNLLRRRPKPRPNRRASTAFVMNLHCNLSNYVSDDALRVLETMASLLRHLNKRFGPAAIVNLVLAYDAPHVSEGAFAAQLAARAGQQRL